VLELTIEELLSSRGRIKILNVLSIGHRMSIPEIIKKTNISYNSIRHHLNILMKMNIVRKEIIYKEEKYKFIINPKNKSIKILFDTWRED
jgi:predicted transcriptional regulator